MENNNELNDIILNKGNTASSNKKIILAVATLGIILIIVVMLMNSISSNGTDNLPQAAFPPKPEILQEDNSADEPLFEDVEVIQEHKDDTANLDEIAKKLKEESNIEAVTLPEVKKVTPTKEVTKKYIAPKKALVTSKNTVHKVPVIMSGVYYIQVGSFSKYAPNKKFLKSITDLHFAYKYHKVTIKSKTFNKVLVGPFKTKKEAQNAKRTIRAKIEPGAFLIKL